MEKERARAAEKGYEIRFSQPKKLLTKITMQELTL
jgi:hypothetical protein